MCKSSDFHLNRLIHLGKAHTQHVTLRNIQRSRGIL